MEILVNHLGYSPGPGARAIMQSTDREELPISVLLRDHEGRILKRFEADPVQEVPGWKSRRFRVLEFDAPSGGPFILEASNWETRAASAPFRCAENLEVESLVSDLLFGFTAYRSAGNSDLRDRSVPFHGDRKGRVDVHGGWYDASGDTSKYLSHLSYANFMNPQQIPLVLWGLLDAYEHLKSSAFPVGDRLKLRFLEEAVWGADFLVRMLDEDGYFYTTVFDRWSKDLDERRICAYETQQGRLTEDYCAGYRQGGGMAVAALARSARVLSSESSTAIGDYGPDVYLQSATKAWRHLEVHNLEYLDDGRENIIDDYCALLAAVELAAAGSQEVLDAVRLRTTSLVERWSEADGYFRADDEGSWSWFHASDESMPLIALMGSLEGGLLDSELAERAASTVKAALLGEVRRAMSVTNPFFHPRHFVRMPAGGPDRAMFFYPHQNPSGYWWQGENARLASWSAAARRWLGSDLERNTDHQPVTDDVMEAFADAQVSWILGLNPFNTCMVQGHGLNNPSYEWDHFNVPGGVANGITSGFEDEDDIAFQPAEVAGSGDHSWRWGEQWIPHAAWLLIAAAWSVPR